MVLSSSEYATISSKNGEVLATHVQMHESEITAEGGVHAVVTALLTREQAARMTLWTTYLIRISNSKVGSYRLVDRKDERLPLRRHIFRSEARS